MKGTVITSMDGSGHLVLPEEVRREAGLKPGMPIKISSREGRVEIEPVAEVEGEPAPQQVQIVPKGRLWVVEPVEPGEPLTAEIVRQTQDWIRDRGLED
ncbi:MAG TPA: AbrB/MazE/SpoVT family DNA-binding domain-containing protein [Thermoanaerobaculia bacterium]|nr:AbrB/MazE/SpoVT family DNA-binding domain-containing protein [Thermoanaerobaculia bacterium]